MGFKLPENSLFAILLRSRWWLSIIIAAAVFALARLFVPPGVAAFFALPFVGIGLYAASQQLRRPSAKRVAKTLERARALPRDEFCVALADGFRREGYAVERTNKGADLELRSDAGVTLVSCERWKAVRTGVEPLREFDAATSGRGAHARIYVAAGEVTDTAVAFAAQKKIRLLGEEELARLLR